MFLSLKRKKWKKDRISTPN